jgi:hypothetical protein
MVPVFRMKVQLVIPLSSLFKQEMIWVKTESQVEITSKSGFLGSATILKLPTKLPIRIMVNTLLSIKLRRTLMSRLIFSLKMTRVRWYLSAVALTKLVNKQRMLPLLTT